MTIRELLNLSSGIDRELSVIIVNEEGRYVPHTLDNEEYLSRQFDEIELDVRYGRVAAQIWAKE